MVTSEEYDNESWMTWLTDTLKTLNIDDEAITVYMDGILKEPDISIEEKREGLFEFLSDATVSSKKLYPPPLGKGGNIG